MVGRPKGGFISVGRGFTNGGLRGRDTEVKLWCRRLKRDTTYAHDSLFIGYTDRFLGPMEVPLSEFSAGGEIPFHRVFYFRSPSLPVCIAGFAPEMIGLSESF